MSGQISFKRELSEGQLAVRDWAQSLQTVGKLRPDRERVGQILKQRCLQDLRLQNDILLSQDLQVKRYSPYLIEYLHYHSRQSEFFGKTLRVENPFDFIYSRNDFVKIDGSVLDSRLFHGGIKHTSTFACILALVNGQKLDSDSWGLRYFANEGILSIIGGGNHRTLAQLMFGHYDFTPNQQIICESYDLPIAAKYLNEVLLEFDKMVSDHRVRLSMRRGSEDIGTLIRFIENSEPEFRRLCAKYIAEGSLSRQYLLYPLTLSEILEWLSIYREWKAMGAIRKFHKIFFKYTELKPFELFLLRTL